MGWFAAWRRRLRQIPLLFNPPENLRRNDVRLDLCAPLTVRHGGQSIDCRSINISASGVLLDARLPFRPGDAVEVTAKGFHLTVDATVLRIGNGSSALRFDAPAAALTLLGWLTGEAGKLQNR